LLFAKPMTKSKMPGIGLHERLYEPNRQIIRPLYCSLSLCLHAYVGFRPHTTSQPLPKSKGNANDYCLVILLAVLP
jgi:hypothetical protein